MPLGTRTALLTAGQTLAKATGLVLALVLVRILSPEEWATMALLFSIYTVATGLGGLNVHQGIYFFYGRLPATARRLLAVQTSALLAAAGLLTGLVVLALDPWLAGGPYRVEGLLAWLALAIVLEMPTLGAPQLLLAAERAGGAASFTAIAAVVQIGAVAGPLLAGAGLPGALAGLATYAALRLAAYALLVVRLTPPGTLRVDTGLVREQIVYTLPLGLSLGTAVLNRNVGKWFVAAFDAPHFGAYALAATEVPFVSIVPYAVGAVLATRLVHAFRTGRTELSLGYWLASTSRMTFLVVPVTIGIILCAPQLVPLLFTAEYAAATLPFQIHMAVLLHRVAEYGMMLRAAGDTPSLWWASLVLLGTNVALALPLTLAVGMNGAAVAMLLANAAAWLYILTRIARVVGVRLGTIFPWGLYGRTLALSIGAALLAWGAATAVPDDLLLQLGLRAVLFAGAVLLGLKLLGFSRDLPPVPPDDPAFAREMGP